MRSPPATIIPSAPVTVATQPSARPSAVAGRRSRRCRRRARRPTARRSRRTRGTTPVAGRPSPRRRCSAPKNCATPTAVAHELHNASDQSGASRSPVRGRAAATAGASNAYSANFAAVTPCVVPGVRRVVHMRRSRPRRTSRRRTRRPRARATCRTPAARSPRAIPARPPRRRPRAPRSPRGRR